MKKKKLLIWSTSVSDLLDGDKMIGGISIQLYFWAQVFQNNGWEVTCITHHQSSIREGLRFQKINSWGKFDIIGEWLSIIWLLIFYRPTIIISRGASRIVCPLAILSKMFHCRYLFFGASDSDFVPGKELIGGGQHNAKLYRKGMRYVRHIVVQNTFQKETLNCNYHHESIILPNIWRHFPNFTETSFETDFIWVANLRTLKRPEWFLRLAQALPQYRFTMIGGPTKDADYFAQIQDAATAIPNFSFLGAKPFAEVNHYISKAKFLVCTSEFEGFPNTFLQAWSAGIPVISTVDPSDLIKQECLGSVVMNEDELKDSAVSLMSDSAKYHQIKRNIHRYFDQYHSSQSNFLKLIDYLYV